MSKHTFLNEARAQKLCTIVPDRFGKIRTIKSLGGVSLTSELSMMSEAEKKIFACHVRQSLNKERRKSLALAASYDISRHIALYLTDKLLRTG